MTETMASEEAVSRNGQQSQSSLSTDAARNLATTTKSVPQMQSISSRWLLKILPWVQVSGGTYRVNRRLTYTVGDGRIDFENTGSRVRVIPEELRELPELREFHDGKVLETLAGKFEQREVEPGGVIVEAGQSADQVILIAHGKVNKLGTTKFESQVVLGTLADGDYFGDGILTAPDGQDGQWDFTAKAMTACTLMVLPRRAFQEIQRRAPELHEHIEKHRAFLEQPTNKKGEAEIELLSGHRGEQMLPQTFADYELTPREYDLSVAQTVLRIHTRVADLYNEPMNQLEQQLRLTIEALRERQEEQLINNQDFGLLHNADFKQRISTHSGPPTPDDMDELLSMRRKTQFFLAHPRAIAAFARECTRHGIYPDGIDFHGHHVPAWRGVPVLPCNKIPISKNNTSSILAMRTGEDDQGVIGLHQTGIPDEYQPSLSVRFMGIDEKAVISYLVSAYYSAAVLVPDALGTLENVELGHRHDFVDGVNGAGPAVRKPGASKAR
jgi:CRP-like cAMP-binding protein